MKQAFNQAVRTRGLQGAPTIQEVPDPSTLGGEVQFTKDHNVFMRLSYQFEGGTVRKLSSIEVFTRHRGGEMWGDSEFDEIALNLMRVFHPKASEEQLASLLRDLQIGVGPIKNCRSPVTKAFGGIEYRRLPGDATRRGTLEIRKAG